MIEPIRRGHRTVRISMETVAQLKIKLIAQ